MIKIESINFFNHPILGTFDLDFKKNDNSIANNIVLAGENGSGKTKIFEEINLFKENTFYPNQSTDNDSFIRLTVNLEDENYFSENQPEVKVKKVELTKYKFQNSYTYNCVFLDGNNAAVSPRIKHINSSGVEESLSSFRLDSIFSKTDINYKPIHPIQGITNKTIDVNDTNIPSDLALDIIQLIIDISTQDAQDVQKWHRENPNQIIPQDLIDRRMNRFTTAFKKMFGDNLNFSDIRENKNPIFLKNGKEVDIISLSSGEKQIVFRGVYLLKNINSLRGTVVLIDEPELSMHPIWEEKIFEYYKSIFVELTSNNQTSQIFMATHSEHILKSALEDGNTLIIKLKENRAEIKNFNKGDGSELLDTLTLAEIKWSIFDLATIDFHIELYGFIQSHKVTDVGGTVNTDPKIKETDKFLERIIGVNTALLKNWHYKKNDYKTLPSYIRNCIDHPSGISPTQPKFSETELRSSIEFMISIL